MIITDDIKYLGVNDHKIDLFEGQYVVPNGMAYNSYAVLDYKTAIIDTVDARFTHQWLDNIQSALNGKSPDYLVVQHMEPDHSANIYSFAKLYKDTTIVSTAKAFAMMKNFYGTEFEDRRIVVAEGDTLPLGKHVLKFIAAPMVHWPEVIVTYDAFDKVLFSADGFGKFGALDVEEEWIDEARRYYFGIVGKYGAQVQSLLKKASELEINKICPLHGPVLTDNLAYYLRLYDLWSSYGVESDGIFLAYTSVYGNTKRAVELLADKLRSKGCPEVVVTDLARCDMSKAVENAFRYGRIVLATTTYNAGLFPFMKDFIDRLKERNFSSRTLAFIENGSWAPLAAKLMKQEFESCKNITFIENVVHIKSALSEESKAELEALSEELCMDYLARRNDTADKNDPGAIHNIGYGVYVVTSNDGRRDNGLIVNTVFQLTSSPNRIGVAINKENYSHHVIKQTGIMNLNCLSVDAPFSLFKRFGFVSGRNVDKFEGFEPLKSDNGLAFLPRYINSFMSLKVEQYLDFGTHGMFVCSVTESRVISSAESMSYAYYHKNVKPRPNTEGTKGFVCKVCGYVYEGDVLPDDFICPLCKHGASDFEPIKN